MENLVKFYLKALNIYQTYTISSISRLFHNFIMGKRSRRRNRKRANNNLKNEPLNELKFFFTSMEPTHSDQCTEPQKLLKQVKDCINEIYTEHISDLEQRKTKRLDCKVPTDYFQPYNLVVNSTYQQRIRFQIQELKKFQFDEIFKESLLTSTDIFIDYLKKHLNEFDGKKGLLQIIILYEAYHTLQNSITQIGAIVDEIISRYAFEIILKKKFYTRVAFDYFDLIEIVSKKENSEYLDDLIRIKAELDNISKTNENDKPLCIEYCSTLYSESCSDDDIALEALHNHPIDELVKIITENPNKRKKHKKKNKQSRISTKDNSTSPNRDEIDKKFVARKVSTG